ncbi:hypothetical protein PSFL107428_14565 [Pseudoalteromonas maricaloris]|nr:hypothetical protein [Pseudoalteromonas flavipulchra NCIMB 2033 = ATCC BAA-314]
MDLLFESSNYDFIGLESLERNLSTPELNFIELEVSNRVSEMVDGKINRINLV